MNGRLTGSGYEANDLPSVIDDLRKSMEVTIIDEGAPKVETRGRKRKDTERFDHQAWPDERKPGQYKITTVITDGTFIYNIIILHYYNIIL